MTSPSFVFLGVLLVATGIVWMHDSRGSPAVWVFGFAGSCFGLGVFATGVLA